jgi:hypothetical protein
MSASVTYHMSLRIHEKIKDDRKKLYNEQDDAILDVIKSGLRIRFQIRIGSGFNRVGGSGSGIRIQEGKNEPQKKKKKLRNLMF